MMSFPWLTVLGLVPLLGALLPLFLKGRAGKYAGIAVSLVTLLVAIAVAAQFKVGSAFQLTEQLAWIPPFGANYALGLDGMGLVMVLMTAILTPVVLLAEWNNDAGRRWSASTFMALILMVEGLAMYVFTASDLLLFYVVFEATLIPMYFLIGAYGGDKAKRAANKFLIYSLAGGLIMLFSIIGVYVITAQRGSATFLLSNLTQLDFSGTLGHMLMVGFLIAFIIKAPMVPLHTWLPDTTEQATPGTSTILVGVLDKIGTFGMIRICLEVFPDASKWVTPFMLTLAVISIIYGGLMAIASTNLLRLVSYTSISHFGVMVLGIYAWTTPSMSGSMFYMVNHGFSTAAMFLVVGYMIKRRGSADIKDFGGIQKVAPILAGCLLLAGLSALSLPGMSSFVSEFMVLAGTWQRYPWHAGFATLAVVLAAIYILRMYQRTMTGPLRDEVRDQSSDLSVKERFIFAPIMVVIFVLGFVPTLALRVVEPTATEVLKHASVTDLPAQAGKDGK
ncbi:homeobox protein SEBOX [Platysternon megacephalum]|uniref:NADH-ubiquinone oxidoreductase chain 4 n=1 Tax=Platysternon megacephalum TaxID=55544 RepID=A0A4D9DGS0_9SAUR|nr:homeobox protein SEBOX [Platysternon megacephalum]